MDNKLQRTDEWYKDRLACVTASCVHKVMSGDITRSKYLDQLVVEFLTGLRTDGFKNQAMQRGIELEEVACETYSLREFDAELQDVGFVRHPAIKDFGASPDRLVNSDGLLEVKCPNSLTHLEFIKTGKIKKEYILQMQTQMCCTGREWCHFLSYDDRLPHELMYKVVLVKRDDEMIKEIEEEVTKFIEERDDKINYFLNRGKNER